MVTKQRDNYKNKLDTFCKENQKKIIIGIGDTIAHLIASYYGKLSKARVGREIADACWTILGGVAQYQLMRHARRYYQQYVFTSQAISAAMDMAGGTCNYRAYKVVQLVEVNAQDPHKGEKCDAYC